MKIDVHRIEPRSLGAVTCVTMTLEYTSGIIGVLPPWGFGRAAQGLSRAIPRQALRWELIQEKRQFLDWHSTASWTGL